jgi:hypothetical protein
MFQNLYEFYRSEEWRLFREVVIAERIHEDGFVYDEITSKPIVKAYDIMLHHKIELTEENVHDYSISLNPDNILLVSQRAHNEIHARFGYCAHRKMYIFHGAPCSGKSSFVDSIKGNSDLIVDIDNLWQAVTGIRYY